jgi:alkanesulfonate monooxygenase SsuD/methylene tetrahydromethanopterin reductase-like flavin-dependent oxidoreductase (luciferase family)
MSQKPLRIGLSIHMRYPQQYRTKSWTQLYRDEIDLVVHAENLGYDTCWVYEHHFSEPEGHCPSPMAVCAALAARTKRMEIGPNLILPFHDPVQVAEESSVIDAISGGRFVLGLVQGYRQREYDAWGIPTKERGPRLSEGVEIIKRCWSGERFSYDGKFWQYKDVQIDPAPESEIPIFYGARAPAGCRRAARDEVGVISQGDGVESVKIYADHCRELGREPLGVRHLRYIWVSDDPEREWAWLKPYALNMMKVYEDWIGTSSDPGLDVPQGQELDADTLRNADMYLIATPEDAAARINKLKEEYPALEEVWGLFHFPGVPHEKVAEQLELFASRVIPQVRAPASAGTESAVVTA